MGMSPSRPTRGSAGEKSRADLPRTTLRCLSRVRTTMHFDSAPVSRIWRSGDLLVGHVPLKIRYCLILSEPYLIDNNIFNLLPRLGNLWVTGGLSAEVD